MHWDVTNQYGHGTDSVVIAPCDSSTELQRWTRYADRSVRSHHLEDTYCLDDGFGNLIMYGCVSFGSIFLVSVLFFCINFLILNALKMVC